VDEAKPKRAASPYGVAVDLPFPPQDAKAVVAIQPLIPLRRLLLRVAAQDGVEGLSQSTG